MYKRQLLKDQIPQGYSHDYFIHLVGRIDRSAEEYYPFFKKNEERFSRMPIEKASLITRRILSSVDYVFTKKRRLSNFLYLHSQLKEKNMLNFSTSDIRGPMVYPFFVKGENLRKWLIKNKVYVACYWVDILGRVPEDSVEGMMAKYLVPLPIDQRYGTDEMTKILNVINDFNR